MFRIRVLVISHMYPSCVNPISGIFVHQQVKALIKQGVDVRVVSPVPSFPLYVKWKGYKEVIKTNSWDGVPVDYVPTRMIPGGYFFAYYGLFYRRALKERLMGIKRSFPFDIVHCHTVYPDGYVGTILKKDLGVPVFVTLHGSDILLYPHRNSSVYRFTEQALQQSDQVIAVSERLAVEAKRICPDVKVETLYNGFDATRFYPMEQQAAREKLGLPPGGQRILFVGNLLPVKGINYLIQAFTSLSVDAHLDIVGDGTLRSALEQQVQKAGLSQRVTFHGRRLHEEIAQWIHSSDAVVLSSLSEGLPSILLEAMGCKKPVIATDVGGISEIVQSGETGYLVPSKDVEALTDAMQQALLDKEKTMQMAENAYAFSKQWTIAHTAKRLEQLYSHVMGKI